MHRRLFTATLCLLAACRGGDAPEQSRAGIAAETEGARAEIAAWIHNFERWLDAGQVDSLATLVTDDYQALAPNQPVISGKSNFTEVMRQTIAGGRLTERFTPEALEVNGPLAVQRGGYTLAFAPHPSAPRGVTAMSDTGKFLWHWRKVDGRWLLAAAAWSSDLPAKR